MVFRFVPPIAFIDASRTERTSFTGTCCADAVVAVSIINVTKTPSLRIVRTSLAPVYETIAHGIEAGIGCQKMTNARMVWQYGVDYSEQLITEKEARLSHDQSQAR